MGFAGLTWFFKLIYRYMNLQEESFNMQLLDVIE